MKRRSFIRTGAAAAVGAGVTGCSRGITVRRELSPHAFDQQAGKPVGTMPMDEIGATGIRVSKFGFGSHMRKDIVPFEKEREYMVREAHELGVNLFDVYDHEQECYQYEPMGRHLKPIINDVVISISILPWDGRTLEQELERDLRLFGRDHIDMVRIHSYYTDSDNWWQWDELFKYKEQGKIRAVGIPIHGIEEVDAPLEQYPIDYVIFPFNYFHNFTWLDYENNRETSPKFTRLVPRLREKGIGVITMKPFAGDNLVYPFKRLGGELDETGEINVAKAALRYVINSDIKPDTTLGGMYYPYHVYENIDAFYHPQMSEAEAEVLSKIRKTARQISHHWLPEHYRFLEDWAPMAYSDDDLRRMV